MHSDSRSRHPNLRPGAGAGLLAARWHVSAKSRPAYVADAIRDPTRYYARPCDVLDDEALSREDKRRILESWVTDADQLAVAEAENMAGSGEERPYLREAKLALQKLAG